MIIYFCAFLRYQRDLKKVFVPQKAQIFAEKVGFKKEAHFRDRIFYKDDFADMAIYTLIKGNEIYGLQDKLCRIRHEFEVDVYAQFKII